jgi:hypothetical protein
MKVQVWTKFSQKKLLEKVKSPLSMNFGRIRTSKCRGKLQKMGVMYTHSLKSPGPSPKLPKIIFLNKKIKKKFELPHRRRCRSTAGGRPLVAGRPWADDHRAATSGRRDPTTSGRRPGRCRATRPPTAGRRQSGDQRSPPDGRRPRAGRQPAVARRPRVDTCACGAVPIFLGIFFLPALHFLCKWSTLAGWLQHMPALPRLLLETSNTHDF